MHAHVHQMSPGTSTAYAQLHQLALWSPGMLQVKLLLIVHYSAEAVHTV